MCLRSLFRLEIYISNKINIYHDTLTRQDLQIGFILPIAVPTGDYRAGKEGQISVFT